MHRGVSLTVALSIALLSAACSSDDNEATTTTGSEADTIAYAQSAFGVLTEVSTHGDSGNGGNDLEVVGDCPLGFSGEWIAEESGTVLCMEEGSFPENNPLDTGSQGPVGQWVATLDQIDPQAVLGLEAVVFLATERDFQGGKLTAACVNENCSAFWAGVGVTVIYFGADGVEGEQVLQSLEDGLTDVLKSLSEWSPADSIVN